MLQLNFSYNWNNKLDCKMFTTIRPYREDKYKLGDKVEIIFKGEIRSTATIINMISCMMSNLPEITAAIDTGYDITETKNIIRKMYSLQETDDIKLQILLLKNSAP